MGKEIGTFYKNNLSKLSNTTLKKTVLSSLASHASPASNLTGISISYILDNKNITTNKKKNKISNTDDIHRYITPRKKITVFRPHLSPQILRN